MSEVQILSPRFVLKMIAKHYIIEGIVQGVGFRYFVYKHANSLGIKGYVRNLPDGTVEVHAEGEIDSLKELESLLWKGPYLSNVTNVRSDEVEPKYYTSFDITY